MTGLVHTRRKKNREAKLAQQAEKLAVVENKHPSHMDQAQKNALSEGKKNPNHLSSPLQ